MNNDNIASINHFTFNRKFADICLSMNILHVGDKLPMQRGFFRNSMGNLLPTLGFLGGRYNVLIL